MIMAKTDKKTVDEQTRAELRKRYTPPEIPKCSICGGELSIQRCGGGGEPTVYACDGYEADPENAGMVRRAAGRGIADKHYEESRYIDWKKGGDSDVVALLDELEAKDIVRSAQDYQFDKQADRIAELENELGHANARNDAKCAQLCKQDEEIGTLRQRIAELEARTLTVRFEPMHISELGNRSDGKKHPYMFGAGFNCAVISCATELQIACDKAGIALDTGE